MTRQQIVDEIMKLLCGQLETPKHRDAMKQLAIWKHEAIQTCVDVILVIAEEKE